MAPDPRVVIHPTAIVAPLAKLGARVVVGPYCVVGPNVSIGAGTVLHSHVVVDGRTTLGEDNQLFPFCSIGLRPQDRKYKGEPSELIIGSRNSIREYVTMQPGTSGGGMITRVGDDNLFMANSHLGHDGIIGNDNVIANSVALAGHVTVGSHVTLGGLAGVHQFVHVGDYSMAGGGSMIAKDIAPYSIVQGDRAAVVGVNIIALERAGFSATDISLIQSSYKRLFFSKASSPLTTRAQELLDAHRDVAALKVLCEFILQSKRGVALAARRTDDETPDSAAAKATPSSDKVLDKSREHLAS